MRRGLALNYIIPYVFVLCCSFVLLNSLLKLPEINPSNDDETIGKFGKMMIDMLPEDLAFTVFVPSEKAFERDLKLRVNESLVRDKINDTYAVISRILGFSVVSRPISSAAVGFREEIEYDSLCGYRLSIWKDVDRRLVVNGVRSEIVDVAKGEIVVHVMEGVIMDAEFRQSVQSDDEDEDEQD